MLTLNNGTNNSICIFKSKMSTWMFLVSNVAKFFTIKLSKVMSASTPDVLEIIWIDIHKFYSIKVLRILEILCTAD